MNRSSQLGIIMVTALLCAPALLIAQRPTQTPDSADRGIAAAADAEMSEMDMHADPHMFMTSPRPANPADSARAARLVIEIRADLARYKNVDVARAAGFKEFLPNIPQPVYHFTNRSWALDEAFRFDPAKPSSLLYRRNADGSFTLVGAMYTEPRRASEADLDKRIPLSVTHWHQHVNWCIPKAGDLASWRDSTNGKPVFGPRSPIATAAACDAVGGRFLPHIFGWMVHANVFVSDDPAVIWGHTM